MTAFWMYSAFAVMGMTGGGVIGFCGGRLFPRKTKFRHQHVYENWTRSAGGQYQTRVCMGCGWTDRTTVPFGGTKSYW